MKSFSILKKTLITAIILFISLFIPYNLFSQSANNSTITEKNSLDDSIFNAEDSLSIVIHDVFKNLSFDELMDDILKKNKGKVIFVDFWSYSCIPCVRQMPYIIDIERYLRSKPVKFISFCSYQYGLDDNWAAEIKRLNYYGEHYLLLQNQMHPMLSYFEIGEYVPQYILIDKFGKIVTNSAPLPENKTQDGVNQDLIKSIEDLVNESNVNSSF